VPRSAWAKRESAMPAHVDITKREKVTSAWAKRESAMPAHVDITKREKVTSAWAKRESAMPAHVGVAKREEELSVRGQSAKARCLRAKEQRLFRKDTVMKAKKFAADEVVEGVRINKYLADAGVCSRRAADGFIEEGKVFIDGERAVMGSRVLPGQSVVFNGKELKKEEDLVLLALNKPRGIVCTSDKREPDNVVDFVNYGKRIYPIGRLDKDSEGLLLLTNDGDIVNKILRAGNYHEKEYIVKVNKMITKEFLQGMAGGVPILDTVTRPCKIEALDKYRFKVILTQGLNRQIRRMCEYFGYRVVHLQRVRIMNIRLGHLKVGDYRKLTPQELSELQSLIRKSSNTPVLHDASKSEGSVTYATAKEKKTVDTEGQTNREKSGRTGNRKPEFEKRGVNSHRKA